MSLLNQKNKTKHLNDTFSSEIAFMIQRQPSVKTITWNLFLTRERLIMFERFREIPAANMKISVVLTLPSRHSKSSQNIKLVTLWQGWVNVWACVCTYVHESETRTNCKRETILTWLHFHQVLDSSREPLLPGVLPSKPQTSPLQRSCH